MSLKAQRATGPSSVLSVSLFALLFSLEFQGVNMNVQSLPLSVLLVLCEINISCCLVW